MRAPRWLQPGWLAREEPVPLEGTRMDLFNSIIPNWWAENVTGTVVFGDASLVDRTWIAAACQHKNAQQISSMPIEFHGPESALEPAWVSSPDPNWYPNGIGDAIYAIVDQVYGYGFSCQYITDRYADGFPRAWTVLPSANMHIQSEDGRRQYKLGEQLLDQERVVQIDRNPGARLHGTSAIRSFAQMCYGLLAAGNQSMSVTQGGIPQAVIKSARKLTAEQAAALQEQWMTATSNRNGAPPVLPPELDFSVLSINPADLSLIETQEWNARMIMNAYGVPSVLMNMALQGGLTYQNPAALGEMWWRFELRNVATRIANAFTAQMLPRGQWITFDAADTFALIDEMSEEDDPQLAPAAAKGSPARQPGGLAVAATGGTNGNG